MCSSYDYYEENVSIIPIGNEHLLMLLKNDDNTISTTYTGVTYQYFTSRECESVLIQQFNLRLLMECLVVREFVYTSISRKTRASTFITSAWQKKM
jgi:hypothetical protein